jgi:hypothetical protein
MISPQVTGLATSAHVYDRTRTEVSPGPIMVQLWSTYVSSGLLNVSSVAIRIASFQ